MIMSLGVGFSGIRYIRRIRYVKKTYISEKCTKLINLNEEIYIRENFLKQVLDLNYEQSITELKEFYKLEEIE